MSFKSDGWPAWPMASAALSTSASRPVASWTQPSFGSQPAIARSSPSQCRAVAECGGGRRRVAAKAEARQHRERLAEDRVDAVERGLRLNHGQVRSLGAANLANETQVADQCRATKLSHSSSRLGYYVSMSFP
jgi:hypothetical protein